jgi:hypothetical protein
MVTLEVPPPEPEKSGRLLMRFEGRMLLIAHRGLIQGPNRSLENFPSQIELALSRGYDSEIDVWYQNGRWALGHDAGDYPIDVEFLHRRGLWIHCKNLSAFFALRGMSANEPNYFWHESDTVVLTSSGHVWTYFGNPETESPVSICVMPETSRTIEEIKLLTKREKWYGICSDYVEEISR